MNSLRELKRRVAAIEQSRVTGPLSRAETIELARLEVEEQQFVPGPIDELSSDQLDDAFRYFCGQIGQAGRLSQLRYRALPVAEQHELRATEIALAAMTADQLDEWMAEMAAAAAAEEESYANR